MDGVEEMMLVNKNVMEEMYFGVYELVYNMCKHDDIFAGGSCV